MNIFKFGQVILCLLLFHVAHSQNMAYDKAIHHFKNNQIKECIQQLEEASKDPEKGEEALYMLFYIHNEDDQNAKAYDAATRFLAQSKDPWPFLKLNWFNTAFFGQSPLTKERLKFLETQVKRTDLPGEILLLMYRSLGNHYLNLNKLEKANDWFKKTGSIQNWSMVGTFDNISAGGFDKDFGALAHPEESYLFTDRNGAKVKWFIPPGQRRDQWIDLEYFFATNNGLEYAQSFITSPTQRKVQIRVGNSGSIKVWLNDGLILQEDKERNNLHDTYIIEAELNQGENRLLVQIGDHEINASDFMIRITDAGGISMNDLISKPFGNQYKSNSTITYKSLQNYHESFFEKYALANAANPMAKIYLSRAYRATDRKLEPRTIMSQLDKEIPNNIYIKGELIGIYNREDNSNAVKRIIEWFKDQHPENNISLIVWMNEEDENKNYRKVDSLLNVYRQFNGENEMWYSRSISLAFDKEEREQGIQMIRTAYKKFPTNKTFMNQMATVREKVDNSLSAAISIYQNYLKTHYDLGIHYEIAERYVSMGNPGKAVEIYAKLAEENPIFTGPKLRLAGYYQEVSNYSKSAQYLEECTKIAPYVSRYYADLGETYANGNQKDKAKLNYDESLKYNIHSYETRRKLRVLEGKKEDIFDYLSKTDVNDVIKSAPDKSAFKDDNSIILAYDRRIVIYESGAAEEKTTLVVKAFTNAGVDSWKQFSIPASRGEGKIEKAELIKANGSRQEAEKGGSTAQFTNLEPGDAIHITYTVEYYNSGKLKNHFFDDHMLEFFVPARNNKLTVMVHPNIKLNYQFNKESAQPVMSEMEGFKVMMWEVKESAALKEEPLRGQMIDIARTVFLSTIPDWNFVSNWYYDLARVKQRPEYDVKEKYKELFEGKSNLKDVQKAEIIYEYIVKNVRYSNELFWQTGQIPQEAAQTINNRQGDCKDVSTLFVALAKEAGLKNPRLILVNNRANGMKSMLLPSTHFDHCIASYEEDGQTRFIELTSDFKSMRTIDYYLKGSFVLPIYGDQENKTIQPFYLDPNNRVPNAINRISTLSFENKDVKLTTTTYRIGTFATGFRADLRDISTEERNKYMTSALSEDFGNVKLDDFAMEQGLDNQTDSVKYQIKCRILSSVNQIAGMNIFSIPWNDGFKSVEFANNETRTFDVEQWRFIGGDAYTETMEILLPAGKQLAEMPKNISLVGPSATYSLVFKMSPGKVVVTRTMKVTKDVISVNEYKDLRKFWQDVVTEDSKQFAFK